MHILQELQLTPSEDIGYKNVTSSRPSANTSNYFIPWSPHPQVIYNYFLLAQRRREEILPSIISCLIILEKRYEKRGPNVKNISFDQTKDLISVTSKKKKTHATDPTDSCWTGITKLH